MEKAEFEARCLVLTDIGTAVTHIQLAERVIRQTLHFVIPDKPIKNLKSFMRAQEALSKTTLGTMTKTLRERVDLHPRFDGLMTRFVENRNILMHHVDDIPGYSMETAEGRAVGRKWLMAMVEDADRVVRVFSALMISYSQQLGPGHDVPAAITAYVGEDFVEMVDIVFQAKA